MWHMVEDPSVHNTKVERCPKESEVFPVNIILRV